MRLFDQEVGPGACSTKTTLINVLGRANQTIDQKVEAGASSRESQKSSQSTANCSNTWNEMLRKLANVRTNNSRYNRLPTRIWTKQLYRRSVPRLTNIHYSNLLPGSGQRVLNQLTKQDLLQPSARTADPAKHASPANQAALPIIRIAQPVQ